MLTLPIEGRSKAECPASAKAAYQAGHEALHEAFTYWLPRAPLPHDQQQRRGGAALRAAEGPAAPSREAPPPSPALHSSSTCLSGKSSPGELKLTVKNTFIDVEADDSPGRLPESSLHRNGARSCTARLSSQHPRPQRFEVETPSEMGSDVVFLFPPTPLGGCTPWAVGDHGYEPSLVTSVPSMPEIDWPSPESLGTTAPSTPETEEATDLTTPAPTDAPDNRGVPGSKTVLQIPLELEGGLESVLQRASEGIKVLLRSAAVDAATGCATLDLRLVVGLPATCTAPAVKVPSPSGEGTRVTAGKAGLTGSVGRKCQLVCCHWRQKGWCRYEDNCKFLHPEHKRGAGMGAMAAGYAPSAAAVPGRHRQQGRSTFS